MTRHHNLLLTVPLAGSALALAACAPALTTSAPLCSETGVVTAPIVGGFASEAHPATVALLTFGQPTCTGTLVAPDLVLIAAHCIAEPTAVPTEIGLGTVPTFAERVAIVDAAVHEGCVPRVVQAGHDVAVLRLAHAVTSVSHGTLSTGDARALFAITASPSMARLPRRADRTASATAPAPVTRTAAHPPVPERRRVRAGMRGACTC